MSPKLPRIDLRVFTVFLFGALPVLAVGVILVLGIGQARLRDSYGRQLVEVAEQTTATVDRYVFRRIIDGSILARVPDVQRLAVSESQRSLDAEAVRTLDKQWTGERVVPAALREVMNNPTARFFAGIVEHDPVYREIMLTDRLGRLIAASNRTSDYYQADEPWWREAFDDGVHGRVSVSDVVWDESARAYAIDIAVPVTDPATGNLVGIMKASADVREMLAPIAGIRLGTTGQAALVREDGSLVFSRTSPTPGARFFAADLLPERLQAIRKAGPRFGTYFSARDPEGNTELIGIAGSQLGQSYPALSWLVAVYQANDELLAPVENQFWYLLLVLVMTVIAVLGLALWFSMRLAAFPVDVEIGPAHQPTPSTVEAA